MDRHCRIYRPGAVVRPRLVLKDRSRVALSIVMPIAVADALAAEMTRAVAARMRALIDILLVMLMQYGHLAT